MPQKKKINTQEAPKVSIQTKSHLKRDMFLVNIVVLCFAMVIVVSATLVLAQTNSNGNLNSNTSVNSNTNTTVVAPTVNFYADTYSVVSGGATNIRWSSSNAVSCTASGGWTGLKPLFGVQTVKLLSKTVYTLTCKGSTGLTTQKSVTINIVSLAQVKFVRGDANGDGVVDVSDISTIGSSLDQIRPSFVAGDKTLVSHCYEAADVDANGVLTIDDATYLISFLFGGGVAPSAPFPAPSSVSSYRLGCTQYP